MQLLHVANIFLLQDCLSAPGFLSMPRNTIILTAYKTQYTEFTLLLQTML